MYHLDLDGGVFGANLLDVAFERLEYLRGLLVGDEPHADLALGGGGYDRLGPFAREAADYAVGVEGGPRPDAFEDREAGFAH